MNPKILDLVPWAAQMPAGQQLNLMILSGIVWLLAAWFVVMECRRRKDRVSLYAFIGGGLAILYEPLGDIMASVLYPQHDQITWIDLFDRPIPIFIGVLYFWYMSVPAIYFLKRLEQGITRAELWRMYFFSLALAIGIELYGVNVDAWVYYGPHPYMVFGVPLWCPVSYSGFLTTISVGLHLMSTQLQRKDHWIIMLGLPVFMAGGHMTMSLPAAAAMFSTSDPAWLWLGATVSMGMGLLLVHVVSLVYCTDGKTVASPPLRHGVTQTPEIQ